MAAVPRRTAKVVRAALAVPGCDHRRGRGGPARVAGDRAGCRGRARLGGAARGGRPARGPGGARRDRAAGGGAHPADPGRPGGHLLRPRHRRHRRPARLLQRGVQRLNRRSQQHLPAVRPRAGTGGRRHRFADPPARDRREAARHPLRQLRHGGAVLGRLRHAVLGHDLADREQRRGDGVRRLEGAGQSHDHRVPVRRGRGHPVLADQCGGPADHQPGQRDLLPVPGPRGHPRRDLAGLAGADPQACHPDYRGHHLDGDRVRGGHLAHRPARRLHRPGQDRVQRDHPDPERRVRGAAGPGWRQLRPGAGPRPAGEHGQLQLHGRHGHRGPERQRAVDGAGLQAVAGW